MLSKLVEKATHVSLSPGVIPGPSFSVRFSGCPTFVSFTMSQKESDDLVILDAEPAGLVLEAGSLPKFDMHMYKSSLTETQVKWLVKFYGILEDLHLRVAPEGNWFLFQNRVGKNCKPCLKDAPTGLKKWKDKFFLVDRMSAPITMAWWFHDSSVADPFPKSSEYDASDVARLREVVISLRKPPPSLLYVAGLSNVWKHAAHVFSLKEPKGKVVSMAEFLRLPNFKGCKTEDMVTVEIPCRVLDDKEKKKRKAKEKAAANASAANIQVERVVRNKDAGKEGVCKKRRVRVRTPVQPDSKHVSSLNPLNHAKPLETLANVEYVSPTSFIGRMGTLQDQTDEHVTPLPIVNAGEFVTSREGVQENVDATFANEGHGDNEGLLLETVGKPTRDKIMPEVEASYSAGRFGNLPFTPYKKELAKVQAACDEKMYAYDQLSKNYEGALTREKSLQDRLEELEEEKKEAEQLNSEQADRIKQLEEALKQSEVDAQQLRLEKERYAVEAEAFSLAVGKGFIDGISIGRKDADIQAILKATPNVDPVSSDIFVDTYEKLFDKRYPYVDKVARMYLLDPSCLQNIMPDETGPTPGEGPRDTPTASYS
ncbi:hypothetical protein Tco_0790266 [Tanacetum coccineum]